jgi:hypothetical protein
MNTKAPRSVVGRWCAKIPSAESFESAVVCLYGVSNVFLEHLSNPGGAWSTSNLQHLSITVMLFGRELVSCVHIVKYATKASLTEW